MEGPTIFMWLVTWPKMRLWPSALLQFFWGFVYHWICFCFLFFFYIFSKLAAHLVFSLLLFFLGSIWGPIKHSQSRTVWPALCSLGRWGLQASLRFHSLPLCWLPSTADNWVENEIEYWWTKEEFPSKVYIWNLTFLWFV